MPNVDDKTADDEDGEEYNDDDAECSYGGDVRYPALVMMVLMMALITMIMRIPMAIENVMVISKTTDIFLFSLFLRCVLSRETPRFSTSNMCICISMCCRERPRDLAHTEYVLMVIYRRCKGYAVCWKTHRTCILAIWY